MLDMGGGVMFLWGVMRGVKSLKFLSIASLTLV